MWESNYNCSSRALLIRDETPARFIIIRACASFSRERERGDARTASALASPEASLIHTGEYIELSNNNNKKKYEEEKKKLCVEQKNKKKRKVARARLYLRGIYIFPPN